MKRKKIKLNLEDFGLDSFLAEPSLDQLNMIGGAGGSTATVLECVSQGLSVDVSSTCDIGLTTAACQTKLRFDCVTQLPPPPAPSTVITLFCPPPPPPPSNCPSIPYISCTHV